MKADIDIDFADRNNILDLINHIPARQITNNVARRHNSGVYVTPIPYDPVNQCSSIDYETAESRGYFKIDFLNMSVYKLITDQAHYKQMLHKAPPWSRLWEDPAWASTLVHIGNYTDLLKTMRPDTMPRMAAFISIIRPGKAHLQNKSWADVFDSVWDGDQSKGYTFKKSHALSYAMLVALHMNLTNFSN
jgi:DNA polymerase III alpha subunit